MSKEITERSTELRTMDVYTFYIEENGNVYIKYEYSNESVFVRKIERLAPITSTTIALIRQNCGPNVTIRSTKFWDDMCLKLINWAELDREHMDSLVEKLIVNEKLNELKSKGVKITKYGIVQTEQGEPILYGPNLTVTLHKGNYFRCIKGNEVGVSLFGFWSSYPQCYEKYSNNIWVFMHILSAFSVALDDMKELLHGYKLTLLEFMSRSTGFYDKGIFASVENMNYIYLNSYMNSGRYDVVRKAFFDMNQINKHAAKYLCSDLLKEMVASNNYYKADVEECLNKISSIQGIESNLVRVLKAIPVTFNNDREYKGEIGLINLLKDYMESIREINNIPFSHIIGDKLAEFNEFLAKNNIELYADTLNTVTAWALDGIDIKVLEKTPKLLEIMNSCEDDPKRPGRRCNERRREMKLEIIKQSITRNINMLKYLSGNYSIWRLYLILSGLERGIPVTKFDDLKMKDEIAEAIYIGLLKNGTDLTEYSDIPNDPRGQGYHARCEDLVALSDSLANGIDIIEEYKKGYNFRELELIAYGKQKNVNTVQYFSKGFQVNEVRLLTDLALAGYDINIEYICGESVQALITRVKKNKQPPSAQSNGNKAPSVMNIF